MLIFYSSVFLFFCFSFSGWLLETVAAAVRTHRYVDRSVLFGPLCIVYGVGGLMMVHLLGELRGNWLFLFLGCAIYATVVEWIAGHLLEAITHTRWWDYSNHRWNLDGYVSLSTSLLWGLMGLAVVQWGTPLLLFVYRLVPALVMHITLWVLLGVLAVDALGTILTLTGMVHKLPRIEALDSRLAAVAVRLGEWILLRTERRIVKAHPQATFSHVKPPKSETFAVGCSFYKLVLLFFFGSLLGDLTETLFCRATAGVWMSRSSLVWGPFSIVWGGALALATWMLYRYKDRPASFLFAVGTFLGGAYEYLCSVASEKVFGTVFWDYSHLPFNLGGRINLLYCFFWGFAAVAWFKVFYPRFSAWIECIPSRIGKPVTWVILVFMICNMVMSGGALLRYNTRTLGMPATSGWEVYMDAHYGDDVISRIYPNAIRVD